MNLTHLSDLELWNGTKELVSKEREMTTHFLWHLKEMENRKLYRERGFSNLFAYCVEGLGYTPGSATRRIKSMKLLKNLPELVQKKVEEALNTGKVSLSNVSSLQHFFEKEKKFCDKEYTQTEKIDLLDKIEGKSQDQCQRLLFSISQNPEKTVLSQDRERILSETQSEIKFVASDQQMKMFQRVREITAHANPHPTYAELFEMLADFMLMKKDPAYKVTQKSHSAAEWTKTVRKPSDQSQPKPRQNERPYTSKKLEREVHARDHSMCTFEDPLTGKICGCKYGLEIDHAVPVALGGESTLQNCRLRCRPHNLLEAERVFGREKMEQHLSRNIGRNSS